jgi:hypothetical protein
VQGRIKQYDSETRGRVNNLLHGIVGEYSHGQIIFCPGHKTFDMVRIAIFESGPDVYPEY